MVGGLAMIRTTLVLGLALTLLAASDARAQIPGGGSLVGVAVLRAKGCRKAAAAVGLPVVVAQSDGTWGAVDAANVVYTGTYSLLGPTGRKLDLLFDASSETTLVDGLAASASQLCGAAVTVTSSVRKKFLLLLKPTKKGTVARLTLIYILTGSAGGRQGTAKYVMKAAGPWVEPS
jgi:hypothetical protein